MDIKNPEINNVRIHNARSPQQSHHLNNVLSRKEKSKGKKKKLTKADIGMPSNFQSAPPPPLMSVCVCVRACACLCVNTHFTCKEHPHKDGSTRMCVCLHV